MVSLRYPSIILALSALHAVLAVTPQVDFDRMGKVGLAGAFAGLDLFTNSSVTFDQTTATLLSRALDGSLTRLASTNTGGSILAGCALETTFYLAGSFSSIDGVPAANIAAYTPSSGAFAAVGTNGPNGQINALFCDAKLNKLWAAGSFSTPGASVALFDPKAGAWSSAPFVGISGAQADITSITTNATGASLFFAGSFLTSFGSGTVVLNGTNNPNVPFSAGASPFSSSLVPIPLQNAQIDASPSSSDAGFGDIKAILCPAGSDGSGNSWFAADNSSPLITVRTFSFISANGVRLGNTFQPNHGTTTFSVATIPDNNIRTLKYIDPSTGKNVTCSSACPLSSDSAILYQDFLFDSPLAITGVQITLASFSGSSAGLHILQLLSSGSFASSVPENNTESCFAPNPSNSTQTGTWNAKVANTDIAGTVQTVLFADVDVGTASSAGPTFTWIPYVSAAGNYDINLLVPGCTNFQDCASRTSVKVTVFPGAGLNPFIQTVSQTNKQDATTLLYSGPILPSSPDFVTTISMELADNPEGNGQNGKYELIADRVELILTSANVSAAGNSSTTTTGSAGLARGFGFLEWPRSLTTVDSTTDGTKVLPNKTLTALDTLGFDILAGLGGASSVGLSSNTRIDAVAHHSSGAIFVGGAFSFSAGPASGSSNIIAFKSGALAVIAEGGLNGAISAFALNGDQLFVGGSFRDTRSGSTSGKLGGIALYDVQKNTWAALGAGVDGAVTSLGLLGSQIQVAGNFTKVLPASGASMDAPGFATWDIKTSTWTNTGGFVAGQMTLVVNGTSNAPQFIAGNVRAAQKFGASGFVMVKNGDSTGPIITPLAVGLSGSGVSAAAASSSSTAAVRRRHVPHLASTSNWISHMKFSQLFGRQNPATNATSTTPSQLPAGLPASAPAVLAGAFWTNSTSNTEITILGGNFTFLPAGLNTPAEGVALYDAASGAVTALQGPQINGTVRALFVDGNQLYVGGEFSITAGGVSVNGLALYDLASNAWALDGMQSLQGDAASSRAANVVVRSITKSTLKPDALMVAGTFAQAGSLRCEAICSFDMGTKQWNALGGGILGEVASVGYIGDNQNVLVAAGLIALADNTAANVVQYSLENTTWASVGLGSDIPGPVSAIEVNSGNASSLFAAGKTVDGTSSFLAFWNGVKWATLGSSFAEGTTVAQLTMVPLQSTHSANSIIESDRVLMISGSLATAAGNASSALFDGQNIIPYVVSTSATGAPGSISSLFHSFTSFSFSQRKFLATGVVILISIAIAAGVVFLLALSGILWTLVSRKDDKLGKFDNAEDDDDSTNHRPSSLLEHINAATRTTILGGSSPYSNYNAEKELEDKGAIGTTGTTHSTSEPDPFGPDASNYMRAATPSDAVGGLLAEETSRPAHARYSFDGTGEGELPISSGAEVEVLDDRDPAWWYARDVRTGREGVVPAAYLY